MSSAEYLAGEILQPTHPALQVVETQSFEKLDPFKHKALLLPGDVELTDDKEKRKRNAARLSVFDTLQAAYGDSSDVTREVRRYQLPPSERQYVTPSSNLKDLEIGAHKYRPLRNPEVYPLFGAMDRGVEAFVRRGGTIEGASKEEQQLFMKSAAAHSILLHTNQRLALDTARRRYGRRFENSPHFQYIAAEAIAALGRSLKLFNYHKGYKLSTFCVTAIHTQTDRYIANNVRTIRLPTHIDTIQKRISRSRAKLHQELGREPTWAEIASETRCAVETVVKLEIMGQDNLLSLDRLRMDANGNPVVDGAVADHRQTDVQQRTAERNELIEVLGETFNGGLLSIQEMVVLSLRHVVHIDAIEALAPALPYRKLLIAAASSERGGLSHTLIAKALVDAKVQYDASYGKVKKLEEQALEKLAQSPELRALKE